MKSAVKGLENYVPPVAIEQLKKKYGLNRIVRLSANENPYGTSPQVAKAVTSAVPQSENYYPDSNCTELRNLIANKLKVPSQNIVFGCGLDEIISMVSRIFLNAGDEVIVSEPTFSEYQINAEIEGAKTIKVAVNADGQNDLPAFLSQINANTSLVWLCNPNNPTGGYNSVESIRQFMLKVPKDVLVLIDEAYIEYVTSAKDSSAVPLLKEFDNLAVMRTFSKAYGLASYRVGYIIMDAKRAGYMQAVRLPYNLNTLSQVAAVAALSDPEFVQRTVNNNKTERDGWEQFLKQANLKYYPSQANFIYFQSADADKIANELLQKGYQVRVGQQPNWIRITIGRQDDNKAIQDIIKSSL